MALDRLVSVRDYADFARNYAGIDKAKARRVFIGGQATVHVTIAGTGDIPIAPGSDLYENLLQSLQSYGDPTLAISLGVRELLIMFISAAVRIEPEFEWTLVDRAIRDALYRAFRFESRELGQDAYLSDVERVIQNVDGVQYVDVDLFDVIEEREYREALSAGTRGAQSSFSASPPRRSLQEIFDAIRKPAGVPAAAISVSDIRLGEDINGIPAVLPAQIAYLSSAVADSLFLREIRS
jgi:hypothetical protein